MDKIKLIFNADDFGLSKGVNLGIIEAHQNGPVGSTTIMAGADAFEHAVDLVKENPNLKVGIHLTLTANKSVGGVYSTLTDRKGNFLSLSTIAKRATAETLDLDEVEKEYEAQIQKVLSAGILPEHFDSHHHTHHLPGVFDVFIKLAKKYNITKARMYNKEMLKAKTCEIRTTDKFEDSFYGEDATIENLKKVIRKFKGRSMEIMTHPAYMDNSLYTLSSYNQLRMVEMDVLTSKELKEFLEQGNYEIATFQEIE